MSENDQKAAYESLTDAHDKWVNDFVQRMNDRTGPHWENYERKEAEFRALGEELFTLGLTLSNQIARRAGCGPAA